ncbi:uncharacterized protein LOC106174629 [Lingula anatina]|uniref:Uncharacterized protein LOC106174629 n=1 Tax=Lingula anatina TaxID=7574 RepID=A0A1S3JN13_LINAN|nr:uncharacterized protein LOC106174629 [Lingula anatina]|eukprot:XP_013411742.1 uncharacterized protein LOC106174629 [Lingula anatina]
MDQEHDLQETMGFPFLPLIPTIIFMVALIIIGTGGNMIVVFVFSLKRKKSTANYYQFILAILDLFACVFLHPYLISKLFNMDNQTNVVLCKIFEFLIHASLLSEGLVLVAVAVDRYYAVCQPLKFVNAFDRTKGMLIAAVAVGVLFSIPLLKFYGVHTVQQKPVYSQYNHTVTRYLCDYSDIYQGSLSQGVFGAVVLVMFCAAVVTVSVLYLVIAKTIHDRHRRVEPIRSISAFMTKSGPLVKRSQKTKVDSKKQSVGANIPSRYSTGTSTSDSISTKFAARTEEVTMEETQAKKVTSTVCEHEEDINKPRKLNKNTPLMIKVRCECHHANSSKTELINDKSEENCEIIDDVKVVNLEQESGTSTEQKNYNMKESTNQQDSSSIKNDNHPQCHSPVSIKTNDRLDDKVGKRDNSAKEHEKTSAWNWPDKPKQLAPKGAKVLFLVTLVFALSWVPFWVIKFASLINPNFWPEKTFVDIAFKVLLMHAFYLNNAINPILYTLMNKAFATDLRDVVRTVRQRLQPVL